MKYLLVSILFLVLVVIGALLNNATLLILSLVASVIFIFVWLVKRTKTVSLAAKSKTNIVSLHQYLFKRSEVQENKESNPVFIVLGFVLGISGTYLNYLLMQRGRWVYMTIAWIILFGVPYYFWNRARNFARGFLFGILIPAFLLGVALLYAFFVTCSIEGC